MEQTRVRALARRIIVAAVALGALALIAYACTAAQTGLDGASDALPAYVVRLEPRSGSTVLTQSRVGIQLRPGYDAYLDINGTTIRNVAMNEGDDGLRKVQVGGLLVEYTPGPGRKVERLSSTRNQVTAFVWRVEDGPDAAIPITWAFDAA